MRDFYSNIRTQYDMMYRYGIMIDYDNYCKYSRSIACHYDFNIPEHSINYDNFLNELRGLNFRITIVNPNTVNQFERFYLDHYNN
jgi:hypothetical protein